MSPKYVDKDIRKKEILHAAMYEMARKGIKAVTIDHIASAAGIGKGTVYEYFSNKEEIFGLAMVEFMEKIENIQAKKLFRATTPQEKIKAIIDSWIEATNTMSHDFMKLLIDIWAEGVLRSNTELEKTFDLKKMYYDYREIVSAILRDGINAGIFRNVEVDEVSGILIASGDGLVMQWLLDKENVDIRKAANTLYETFMEGILVK